MKKSKFLKTDEPAELLVSEENLSELLEKNIKDYGMSVIEDRMIPSVRDGLKPAQRRLLKAMYDLKAWNTSPTVKSARVTGDCMGKYHPHSEAYGALANLVNQSYSLVHGQGNWGGLDDDPAAPRYTECKMSKLGQRCFESYSVADEVPNFSGEYMEPIDIPMDFPSFFVNGGKGIGVAIRVETPNHNLEEVVNALKIVLKKGDKTKISDIMKVFHGPDSIYGGRLLSTEDELKEVYSTGAGKITYECDYTITPQGKNYILNVTGYCPEFKPSTFQNAMIKLIDEKLVIYANDASTKDNKCNFEVMFTGEDTFEKKIHKHLICSQNIQYYALDRRKSKTPELRDIDTVLLKKNLIEYMQIWLDWRRDIECKLLDVRKDEVEDKIFHSMCRMKASENLDVIKKALEADDTTKYLMEHLLFLKKHPRSKEGAEYISDLKIGSLKKVDIAKVAKEIQAFQKELEEIEDDKNNIDRVISKKLDGLKEFFKPRMLKVG